MTIAHSKIYWGKVMHHRFGEKPHRFIYRVFSSLIDLDELSQLDQVRGFSVNRFNLLSFHEADYGVQKTPKPSLPLKERVCCILADHGLEDASASIRLLCYPRLLGFVFNPLTVYFCYNAHHQLGAVIYEVSNTFGERHSYVFKIHEQQAIIRQRCQKEFFVSPFIGQSATYNFRIKPPAQTVAICIHERSEHKPLLNASFTGDAQPFNAATLLKSFLKYPLMTLKVFSGIHWEAFHLWRKGFKIHSHIPKTEPHVTYVSKAGVQQHETS